MIRLKNIGYFDDVRTLFSRSLTYVLSQTLDI